MPEKTSISLDEGEILELQRLLTDRDGEGALVFLREVVWHRLKAANRKLINPRQGTGSQG